MKLNLQKITFRAESICCNDDTSIDSPQTEVGADGDDIRDDLSVEEEADSRKLFRNHRRRRIKEYISKVVSGAYSNGIYYFINNDGKLSFYRDERYYAYRWNGHLPLATDDSAGNPLSRNDQRRSRLRRRNEVHQNQSPSSNNIITAASKQSPSIRCPSPFASHTTPVVGSMSNAYLSLSLNLEAFTGSSLYNMFACVAINEMRYLNILCSSNKN